MLGSFSATPDHIIGSYEGEKGEDSEGRDKKEGNEENGGRGTGPGVEKERNEKGFSPPHVSSSLTTVYYSMLSHKKHFLVNFDQLFTAPTRCWVVLLNQTTTGK